MRKYLFTLIITVGTSFGVIPLKSFGQSFWFTFNTIPYVEIGGNFLTLNEAFDDTLYSNVPIGFQFRFAGKAWTKLHISSNGEIYFGEDPDNLDTLKAIIPFGADLYGDYINHTPAISYESGGCAGAVVMKIQFKECSLKGGGPDDFISFQVWLYESSGMVEYHFGPGQAISTPMCFGGQSGPMCGIRLTIPESGNVLYSLLLTSFAFGPDTSMSAIPSYLEGIPENGMVYILEPSLTTGTPDQVTTKIQPFLTFDHERGKVILHYKKQQPGISQAAVFDISGRNVSKVLKSVQSSGWQQLSLDIQKLKHGTYFIRFQDGKDYSSLKFTL